MKCTAGAYGAVESWGGRCVFDGGERHYDHVENMGSFTDWHNRGCVVKAVSLVVALRAPAICCCWFTTLGTDTPLGGLCLLCRLSVRSASPHIIGKQEIDCNVTAGASCLHAGLDAVKSGSAHAYFKRR